MLSLPPAIPAEEICEVFGPGDNPDEAVLSLLRQDKSIVRRQNERELRRMTGEKEGAPPTAGGKGGRLV